MIHENIGKECSRQNDSKCKSPEIGESLACLGNKEASGLGAVRKADSEKKQCQSCG